MMERFAFCRKCNLAVCTFSCIASLLATTRWLHFGNVNGFRYLGYALTCPLMQAELVVLIAPIVPCYRIAFLFSALASFACIATGYAGSLIAGPMWEGSIEEFLDT